MLSRIEDFFNDFAELIHLDRENAAILALVIELGDGITEREIDGLDAVSKNVLEADEQRKF